MSNPAGTRTQNRRRGFTLVEILVAFAILALTLAAIMRAMSGGIRILSVSDAHVTATRIAENRLAEAGRTGPLLPGSQEGETDGYRWRVDIAPLDGEAPSSAPVPLAYEVNVVVSWGNGRRVELTTIELGPPAND